MPETGEPLAKFAESRGYGRRYPHRGHYIRNFAIGLIVFVVSCLTIHAFRPFPDIPKLTPKLRYFAAHKDEFDTIFIGSSHVYRGIVPRTFDSATESAALPTHSFNFGLDGMRPPESLYFLDQVLLTKPSRLKWVFVELEEVSGEWSAEQRQSRRFYYWHDWRFTRAAIEEAIDPSLSLSLWRRLGAALQSKAARLHLRVFCTNMGNVGAVNNGWDELTERQKGRAFNRLLKEDQGFVPQPNFMPADRAEDFVKNRERRKQEKRSQPVDAVTDGLFRETDQSVARIGARIVYIVPPGESQIDLKFRQTRADSERVLAFNDIQKYPELYDLKLRADEHHLTVEGAKVFTRLLAGQFVREIAAVR